MTQPDPNAQSGEPGTQSGGAGTGTGETLDPGTQSGGETGQVTPPAETGKMVPEAEVEAVRARMRAADQRASQFEAELRQLRDKDLPAAEKLQRDYDEAVARAEKAETDLRSTRIDNAFFRDNTHEWHNPDRARALLDMSKVDIDDQGTVTGLKNAIDALAKSDPYLIKPPKADDGEANNTPPGTAPGNAGGSGGGQPSKEKMRTRFGALRNRA